MPACVQRLQHLLATKARPDEKALRLTVEAGGCSGFSYRCAKGTLSFNQQHIYHRDCESIHAYSGLMSAWYESLANLSSTIHT